jgi:predicted nucleic acid-binding protein
LRLTIDSFAWVELIRGGPRGARVRDLIEGSETSYTPSVVLAEVAHRCLRDGLGEMTTRHELSAIQEASVLVPLDRELAIAASAATSELRRKSTAERRSPAGLADGIVLAAARRLESKVLTGDLHFRGLPNVVWLG